MRCRVRHGDLLDVPADASIDPLIAATAVRHGLALATRNRQHFERVAAGYALPPDDRRTPPGGAA